MNINYKSCGFMELEVFCSACKAKCIEKPSATCTCQYETLVPYSNLTGWGTFIIFKQCLASWPESPGFTLLQCFLKRSCAENERGSSTKNLKLLCVGTLSESSLANKCSRPVGLLNLWAWTRKLVTKQWVQSVQNTPMSIYICKTQFL